MKIRCSNCGWEASNFDVPIHYIDVCPRCGAIIGRDYIGGRHG